MNTIITYSHRMRQLKVMHMQTRLLKTISGGGNDKGYYFTDTKSATTSLLNKEDGHDVREEIKVYESARTKQLDSYKEVLENEVLVMNKIGQ